MGLSHCQGILALCALVAAGVQGQLAAPAGLAAPAVGLTAGNAFSQTLQAGAAAPAAVSTSFSSLALALLHLAASCILRTDTHPMESTRLRYRRACTSTQSFRMLNTIASKQCLLWLLPLWPDQCLQHGQLAALEALRSESLLVSRPPSWISQVAQQLSAVHVQRACLDGRLFVQLARMTPEWQSDAVYKVPCFFVHE